jgi:hypothetical protein
MFHIAFPHPDAFIIADETEDLTFFRGFLVFSVFLPSFSFPRSGDTRDCGARIG